MNLFKNWFMSTTQANAAKTRNRRRLGIEALQDRTLLSITFDATSGVVSIEGTLDNDVVEAIPDCAGNVDFFQAIYDSSGAHLGGDFASFPTAVVNRIDFHGYGGDDYFRNDTGMACGPGIPSRAWGDAGQDELIGGAVRDVFHGGPGPDTLDGRDGSDILHGDGHNDHMHGGSGRDYMHGGRGVDTMYGDAGPDVMWGGLQGDFMYGGAGRDVMHGEGGADVMHGDAGNDILRGGDDADELHGGDGADELFGEDGADTLHGENGNDTLDGGYDGDVDQLYGGLDADTFVQHWAPVGLIWLPEDSINDFSSSDPDTVNNVFH